MWRSKLGNIPGGAGGRQAGRKVLGRQAGGRKTRSGAGYGRAGEDRHGSLDLGRVSVGDAGEQGRYVRVVPGGDVQ